ncbi:MAG: hypothetical protein EA369_01690 [Bradymonadales bacterium]|nr:MAG: hypothetical protein EA369_01690 [Bradymonadales bacterium]
MKVNRWPRWLNTYHDFPVMMKAYFSRVSFLLWPLLLLYGMGCGALIYIYYLICKHTCSIEVRIPSNMPSSYIRCVWHQNFNLFLTASPRFQREVWMNHPQPYMIPWYFVSKLLGVFKMIPGSSGHSGRIAADHIVGFLRQGYCTSVLPDGPNGPPRTLEKGILHMAQQGGVPIVPIIVRGTKCIKLKSWDSKLLPIPFVSKIQIQYLTPTYVQESEFVSAERDLVSKLNL